MDVRELLARLNPSTVKFDVGRGGVPELTNQDIAAALAFVPPGLGREVLEACWWPDGARLRRNKLRDAVMAAVQPELAQQAKRITRASLDLQLAEAAVAWGGRGVTAEQRAEIDRLRGGLRRTRERCWPSSTVASLPTLAAAIISEIRNPRSCPACEGRGQRLSGELLVPCVACGKSGRAKPTDKSRADALRVSASNYIRTWRPVYEWLFAEMWEAETEAAAAFMDALARAA